MSADFQISAKLLLNTTSTGDGSIVNFIQPVTVASFQCELFGAPTRAQVNIMGILDGATFDTLAVMDTAQGYLSGEIVTFNFPIAVRTVKANIGVLSGGTNPAVSCYMNARA